ncbi:carboxylating nicotinate-nucleotide diphosphorylase [Brumimicrobium aurantiacum]|uniref:Probable nicotinate-nucleotide pyrophosphorylase [carboxylating] n=1 Tax=Brumimicrobium aurantiacum TaxID=1737063 RepID=A0A3E1EXU4_9FLAO|nr:carboxylating nicotinate-nucleotide diphosphorylase [Brumimicrobium aurantiacum]RFC54357.1 carboxylating nicotinate-nucleotide diphosphorylase [Brumimicrobium aurantiacum]
MIDQIIKFAFEEDIQEGDHTSLSCVPENATGKAKLLVKEDGVLAGMELAERIFNYYDSDLKITAFKKDGDTIKVGEIAFEVEGKSQSILATERIVLNFMQRMSAIATQTRSVVDSIKHTDAKLLDTRKTTPGIRAIEKWAVKIGGGHNHRFGLYDMIMIKDNHIDYSGGIEAAITKANQYIQDKDLDIKIEIEVRDEKELDEVLAIGNVDRIMLDNFTPEKIKEVLSKIPSNIETEASGGINKNNIVGYAESGVNYISSGALTHSVKSMDLSLKAIYN